ncbi:MFS transporter [Saccharothrix sp. S26]|uniref:MFS transporter n=1 Tax=Saccharothrix sp. S26 TaxID=2907215 RepID=UPI001F331CA1|nr:MFS transporter [Saccharothrix sp. S26]MCE6996352.1 MFS transporter [Saccharothrix sp. S26]
MPDLASTPGGAVAPKRGLTLTAVCLTVVLFPLAIAGSAVAVPAISADLGNSLAAGQWVINGYNLTYAGFMLATGSVADIIGRRRMFRIGVALFGLGSLLSAIAPGIALLDIARAIAGVGAAAATTSGSAILADTFDGPARARAFGLFGTAVGLGLAFGPTLSGVLTSNLGWRAVFALPAIVTAVVLFTTTGMTESRNPHARKVDVPGMATFTLALLLLVLALIQGPQSGWGSGLVIGSLVASAVMLVAFTIVEKRSSEPMFDLSLLRQPRFVGVSLATIPVVFGFTPLAVYLPSYFMAVNGVSAQQAGLLLIMLTGLTLIFPSIAGYATRWLSAQAQIVATVAMVAVGMFWLVVIEPKQNYLVILPPLALIGIAVGISFGLLDGLAVSSVPSSRAGMAAGMFNTVRLAGETVAIGVAGAVLISITQAAVADSITGFSSAYRDDPAALANLLNQGELAKATDTVTPASDQAAFAAAASEAFTTGIHGMVIVLGALCAVTFVVVGLLLRARTPVEDTTGETEATLADRTSGSNA